MTVRADGARWYNAVWRWHFYAGLFCLPFVIWLALTGTIYVWRPQIEAMLDRPYDHLPVDARTSTPDAQVAAALAAVPGSTLQKYMLPEAPDRAVRVLVKSPEGEQRVYVDPRSLAALNVVSEDERPLNVIMRLHGELLAGPIGSYSVEIAACWTIVMLLTGVYLWWPRGRKGLGGVLYPRLRARGRAFWRDLHAVAGIWVSVLALGLIVTGLPWAAAWGAYLGEVRALTGTANGPVDWTIGGKKPAAREDAMLGPHAGHTPTSAAASPIALGELERVIGAVRPLMIAPPVLISPPERAGEPWRVASDAANRPARSEVEVDGATGGIVGRLPFADRHWIDRVIGYGIAVHEGALFGLANQLLCTATALLLVVLASSGATMWWRRRPTGLLGAPRYLAKPAGGAGLVTAVVALGICMPLFGVTLLLVFLVEASLLRRWTFGRRWLGL